MEHTAIRNLYPDAVSIVGNKAYDKDNKLLVLDDALVQNEIDRLQAAYDALGYARARKQEYPNVDEFMEAYTEKEIGGNSSKWDEYVIKYNKVRSDNPKL